MRQNNKLEKILKKVNVNKETRRYEIVHIRGRRKNELVREKTKDKIAWPDRHVDISILNKTCLIS